MRMTVDETKVYKKAWNLHAGDSEPIDPAFPLNPEIYAAARFWLLRSHLYEHIENAEAEIGSCYVRGLTDAPQDESPFSLFLFETRARPSSTRRLQPACRSRETASERSTRRSPSASEGEGRSSKVEQCHIQTD